VSVAPNLTEMLFAAGAADQVVAVSAFSDYPEAARALPQIGDAFRLDYERIVALAPTVAVIWKTGTPAGVAERLQGLGIRVVSIPTEKLDDIATGVETLGALAGTGEVAGAAARDYRQRIAALRERYGGRPQIRVFVQIDGAPLFTIGGPHLITEILGLCGGVNVFAEIPSADPTRARELVMVGAHLDSWHAGTGATDDGAGVLIAMEAMRILRALDVRPRRTIRVALWTGEEQGALGSLAWVTRELATIPRLDSAAHRLIPEAMRTPSGPPIPKPGHASVSAMYDLDQGGGRIRGVRVNRDTVLMPLFERWIAPLKDLGVAIVSPRGGCASDCLPFEQAGIPAPRFLQDPLDYTTRTLHSSSDTLDHLIPDDLKQAAVVVATFLYNTAQRDEMLPRK